MAEQVLQLGQQQDQEPPQPPRPDLTASSGAEASGPRSPQAVPQAPAAASASCGTAAASCFSASSGSLPDDSGSTSDLIRAAPRTERDLRTPTTGLARRCANCAPCAAWTIAAAGSRVGASAPFPRRPRRAAGCCCASSGAGAAASSSSSSGSPAPSTAAAASGGPPPRPKCATSPRSIASLWRAPRAVPGPQGAPAPAAAPWSPTACGGKKLLNKCGASAAEESGAGKKDKVRRPWPH